MRRAFVMGSNGPSNLGPLRYARKDVEDIRNALTQPRCSFEVTLPTAGSSASSVRDQMNLVAESCADDDIFICYFAGHGLLHRGALYLLWDNFRAEQLLSTTLPVSALLEALRICGARQKLLILDCCHAGAAEGAIGLRSAASIPIEQILIEPSSHLILMAGERFELTREVECLQGGFLTQCICRAVGDSFHEADNDRDQKLSIEDLGKWLEQCAHQHNTEHPNETVPCPYFFGKKKGSFFLTIPSNSEFGFAKFESSNARAGTQDWLDIPTYAEQYRQRYGQINVLGMGRPMPLDQLYTQVQVVTRRHLQRFSTIEGLEELYSAAGRTFFLADEPRRDGFDAANEFQYLNVLGAPGSGKSTFLARLGLEALAPVYAGLRDDRKEPRGPIIARIKYDKLPVFIRLSRFREEQIDLKDAIANEFRLLGSRLSPPFTERALREGRFLILLDGLDEITESRAQRLIDHIRDFVDGYPQNHFVTSCRTAFYKTFFPRFTDVVIADFTSDQIKEFVFNWFRGRGDATRPDAAGQMWGRLRLSANRAAREIAATPILLTLLCIAFSENGTLPENRSLIYQASLWFLLGESFKVLQEKWAAQKQVHTEPVAPGLNTQTEIQMLAEIAGTAMASRKLFFTREDLTQRIDEFIRSELSVRSADLIAEEILDAIEVTQGLLVERFRNVYSFSHLSIQEFLAAVYFRPEKRFRDLVHSHLFDNAFREVFLLLAGLQPAAGMLDHMARHASDMAALSKPLRELFQWLEAVCRRSDSPAIDASRRAALVSVLFVHALAFALPSELALSRDLAIALAVGLNPEFDRHLHKQRAVTEDRAAAVDKAILANIGPTVAVEQSINRERATDRALGRNLLMILRELDLVYWDLKESSEALELLRGSVDPTLSFAARLSRLRQMTDFIFDALKVPDGIRRWDVGSCEVLNKYLYAAHLVMACKAETVSIKTHEWNEVASGILVPPRREERP